MSSTFYLTVNDVATRLSVSKDTIWRWARLGTFPEAVRLSAGATRWRTPLLEAGGGERTYAPQTIQARNGNSRDDTDERAAPADDGNHECSCISTTDWSLNLLSGTVLGLSVR